MEEAGARPRLLSLAATRAGIAFALAALTLAVFVQIRHHDFVDYDDYVYAYGTSTGDAGFAEEIDADGDGGSIPCP